MTTSAPPKIPEALARQLEGGNVLKRSLQLDRASIDVAARTVQLAFASEAPYERYWGIEILSVTPASMRLERMGKGGAFLSDHDTRKQIGVVEKIEVGTDRVARAVVRFGNSARAQEEFQDVQDGIRQNVSFGYLIHEAVLVGQKDGVETYQITDYEPYEISLVSVPADINVGVGRSLEATDAAKPAVQTQPAVQIIQIQEEKSMNTPAATPVADQRNVPEEIGKIAQSMGIPSDVAMRSIAAGHTIEQFQESAIRHLSSKPVATADIGLTDQETRSFSMIRALNAMANPNDAQAQKAAAFERACSDAVGEKMGKRAQGFFVPHEVQKRDLTAGIVGAGGATVQTDLMDGSFIEMLRHRLVLNELGVTFLSGLTGNIAIPKQTGAGTAYWVSENANTTESQQAFAQINMTPKTLGAFTDISRRLLTQSSIGVEQLVNSDLATILALELQRVAFHGTGVAPQPGGLTTLITVPTVNNGANGGPLSWNNVVDLETAISSMNADVSSMGYVTNAKVRGAAKRTQKFATTNGDPVWDAGNTPLNGYKAAVTNTIQSNVVKGTGTGLSTMIFGNWSDMVIGAWGTMDVLVDPYTGGAAGTLRTRVMMDVDIGVRNLESFATITDISTI